MILVAAAALINETHNILLARRGKGKHLEGLWEFPGGKIDPGESPSTALSRELREELAIDVNEKDLLPLSFNHHVYAEKSVLILLYECRKWQGKPTSAEGQEINWFSIDAFPTYEMPLADLPLVETLKESLAAKTNRC